MKPHKISTHLAYSDNCYFHLFLSVVWLSWNFARFHKIQFQTEPESFSFLSWKTKKKYSCKKTLNRCQFENKKALFTVSIFPKVLVFPSYKFPLDFSSCAQMIAKATNVYPKKSTTFSKSLFFLLVMYVVSNLSYSSKVSTTSITAMGCW